jgi:hypothetical protein
MGFFQLSVVSGQANSVLRGSTLKTAPSNSSPLHLTP